MYAAHFNLREPPFSIAPDPAFLYMSARHQEALGHLLYGTGQYGGFVQLTGEVGTGKTTIVRTLLSQKLGNVDVAMIHNPRQNELEFVASICDELGVAYPKPAESIKILVDALNEHLLRAHADGRRTVLIIDEAQNLDPKVLEQVRLLTNLETDKEKLLRIMLIGQPELIELLARPDLRQLASRITARYHLMPLTLAETTHYIIHRVQVAGGPADLFADAAMKRVHRYSHGIPRQINIICDRALLGAYAKGLRTVRPEIVDHAAAETLGSAPAGAPPALKAAPRTRFNVAIDAQRAYAFRSLPLQRIKGLKRALSITVNDAVLALCAGALRAYLQEKGELPERPLVAAIPISVRTREDRKAGGNRLAMLTAELPTHYDDPLQRVAAVSRSTAKLKRVHRAVPAKLLMDWVELPAPALMARAARLYENFINSDRLKPPVNVMISNVPGPPVSLYLAGAPLLANYPISIPYHGLALNITVLSYRDQLDVGLTAGRDAVPDLPHLMDLLAAALDELEAAAGLTPARARAKPASKGGKSRKNMHNRRTAATGLSNS